MKHLYLHIGMPKTGTTSLQRFLLSNKEALAKNGIGYYSPRYFSGWRSHQSNAAFIKDILCQEHNGISRISMDSRYSDELISLRSYAQNCDILILSEELFWALTEQNILKWESIHEILIEVFGENCDIHPLVYLRRQDDWMLSWWKEVAHMYKSSISEFNDFLKSADDRGALDYYALLRKIESSFGRLSIIVKEYDRRKLLDENIAIDFLSAIGVPWSSDYILRDRTVNPSITIDAAQASILIRRDFHPFSSNGGILTTTVRDAIKLFALMFPQEKPLYPMDHPGRRAFLDKYSECNKAVSLRYLDGAQLFDEEIQPYDFWRPDYERDKENAEFIMKLARSRPDARHWIADYLKSR